MDDIPVGKPIDSETRALLDSGVIHGFISNKNKGKVLCGQTGLLIATPFRKNVTCPKCIAVLAEKEKGA